MALLLSCKALASAPANPCIRGAGLWAGRESSDTLRGKRNSKSKMGTDVKEIDSMQKC